MFLWITLRPVFCPEETNCLFLSLCGVLLSLIKFLFNCLSRQFMANAGTGSWIKKEENSWHSLWIAFSPSTLQWRRASPRLASFFQLLFHANCLVLFLSCLFLISYCPFFFSVVRLFCLLFLSPRQLSCCARIDIWSRLLLANLEWNRDKPRQHRADGNRPSALPFLLSRKLVSFNRSEPFLEETSFNGQGVNWKVSWSLYLGLKYFYSKMQTRIVGTVRWRARARVFNPRPRACFVRPGKGISQNTMRYEYWSLSL